jgi:hypothetical protein
MHLLMSGTHVPTTLAWEYASGFEALGCSVSKHYGSDERSSSPPLIFQRILRRTAPRLYYGPSNRDLLRLADSGRPDAILLFKAPDIFPETIRQLRQSGFHPAVYNADHPFDFYSRGSGNELIAGSVPEYDLYLTYSRHIADQLADRYPTLPTRVIPFGHSVDDATYDGISNQSEIVRVCFLGNADADRADKIATLVKAGLEVDVYGHAWEQFGPIIAGASLCGPANGLDMYRTLRRYRVQLNFLRPHNIHSHNMRSFEAPACGAIMLAEDTVEHREFFKADQEAFYFANDEEMIGQARRLLALSPEEADAIRARARARSVNEPYSYHHRAAQALTHLKELVGHD